MPEPTDPSLRPRRVAFFWGETRWIALIVLVCSGLYFSTASPQGAFSPIPQGYYGLLTAGFQRGHLYAAITPHPALLALPDPYDPVANAPYRVHDMSLYQGRYYVYFGVPPVLLLFLPVELLIGWYPTEPFAVAFSLAVGLAAGAGLILSVRRRWFPRAPAWIAPLAVACFGLASPVAVLAPSSEFYQVPIAGAYALHVMVLGALLQAMAGGRRRIWWLAAASLGFGLSVGARPNYLLGGLMLALAAFRLWWTYSSGAGAGRKGEARRLLLAAFGPAAAVGAGLLLYNWLRFGSATEFGVHYMLAGSKQIAYVPFSLANLWDNGRTYLFGGGAWSSYFPFFAPIPGTTLGMFRYLPWLWLGLLAFRRPDAHGVAGGRHFFAWILTVSALANLALLAVFTGVNDRYSADIVPTWLLLGAVGALAAGEIRGRAFRWAVVGAGVCSIFIGQAVLFRRLPLEGRLLDFARVMNRPTALIERMRGEELGALRLELELPAVQAVGTTEPLFQTGLGVSRRDWLYLEYLSGNRARISFFHAGLGALVGNEFAIPADRRLTVEARCGSLLPPPAHPYYAGWDSQAVDTVRRDLQVKVNGVETLRAMLGCYESTSGNLLLGALAWPSGGIANQFSGRIMQATRLPFAAVEPRAPDLADRTPVELTLMFPADRQAGAEPILVTGAGKQSDLLYCLYQGRNGLRFALDHYGNGGPWSELIEYDPLQPHRLTVWMGSLAEVGMAVTGVTSIAPGQRLVVLFDGKVVLNVEQDFYPAAPASAVIGLNAHQATTAEQRFSGRVAEAHPVPLASLPPLVLDGERGAVEMTVAFPTHVMGVTDPLVVTGLTGRGDILYVKYIDPRHVSFGFDHWGVGGLTGDPIEIDYGQPHRLELTMGSLYAAGGREDLSTLVRVKLDGKTVLEGKSPTHPSTAGQIHLLANPIGGSTCGPSFNGRMVSIERLPEPRR